MWLVIKEKFKRRGPLVMGGTNYGKMELQIDRVVETLDDVESGEMFCKINIKK